MSAWISCGVRMPKEQEGKQYLILLNDGRMAVAEISYPFSNELYAMWYGAGEAEFDMTDVTHWRALPKPPESRKIEYTEYLGSKR